MAEKIKISLPKPVGKRQRGANTTVGKTVERHKAATGPVYRDGQVVGQRVYASAGKYTSFDDASGDIVEDIGTRDKIRAVKRAGVFAKQAGLFSDGGLGFADIADSQNVGYYSYEFPVDALEMPQSRAEEIRFFRLAYDRDPIVGRAIDLHTELPLSKMTLEKPKCSSEEFADYVYDFFQRLKNNTDLFQVLIDAVREYWTIGECFMFFEELQDVEPCKAAKTVLDDDEDADGTEPGREPNAGPIGGTSERVLDFLSPEKRSSWLKKATFAIDALKKVGMEIDLSRDITASDIDAVKTKIIAKRAALNKLQHKIKKQAKLVSRGQQDQYPLQVTAAPGDPPAAPPADNAPAAGPGAPMGPAGADGVAPAPGGGDLGGADIGGGGGAGADLGGGGGGGGAVTPPDQADAVRQAIAVGATVDQQRELMEMRHYLKLLDRQKVLLEELKDMRDKKKEEMELFQHVINPKYKGFKKIQILPPEQIELSNEGTISDGPTIYYKPPEEQKQVYLESEEIPAQVKDIIQQEGKVPLNQDPFNLYNGGSGSNSYVIHFARKKSGYELHGRSILQRCIRTVIYREKLRQVQSTLASRNMTPINVVIAPEVPASELAALRAHVDEAIADPDYAVIVNYEMQWNQINAQGRLLALEGEWNHTNSDLSIGLGLSPEILIGEGLYSGNRIQLEIMNTSYLQFRDLLTGIIEDKIFKPIAMKKGFYEIDKYGNPRWIYPKVTFARMALRDSGDLYDMLFNLYAKGSLPVDIILDFLNIDSEDCKRKLEDNLFTVNDAKFSAVLDTCYGSMGEWIIAKTDIGKRITKGLTLDEVDNIAEEGPEGSGEGM